MVSYLLIFPHWEANDRRNRWDLLSTFPIGTRHSLCHMSGRGGLQTCTRGRQPALDLHRDPEGRFPLPTQAEVGHSCIAETVGDEKHNLLGSSERVRQLPLSQGSAPEKGVTSTHSTQGWVRRPSAPSLCTISLCCCQ